MLRDQSDTVLVLRTCDAKMQAHGGFQWPKAGAVSAPDWHPGKHCGNGLHGLLWGQGDGSLLCWDEGAHWLVVEVDAKSIVDLQGKAKFPRGTVVHCGDRSSAAAFIVERRPDLASVIIGGTATAGDYGTATAGYRGTATAGDYGTATAGYGGTATAGYRGTATAGDYGTATAGYGGTATAGYRGTATAGDYGTATACYRGTATAGYRGTATAGYRGTATAGDYGTATAGDYGTATAGYGGTATAGEEGTISVMWWDGRRRRIVLGYVGEDGIEAGAKYCVVEGKLTKIAPEVKP